MRRFLPLVLSGLLLAAAAMPADAQLPALSALSVPAAPAGQPLLFDFAHTHNFAGFGVQVWTARNYPVVRDVIMRDLNASWVRMSIPGKVSSADLHDGITAADISDAFARREIPEAAEIARGMARDFARLGIRVHLMAWEMPQQWRLPEGHHVVTVIGRRADPAHIADYAGFVAGQALYARRLGFHVALIDPCNEPDVAVSTLWSPADYAKLIKTLRATLDKAGLQDVGIEAPGATIADAQSFFDALAENDALRSVAALSVHDWNMRQGNDDDAGPLDLPAGLRKAGDGRPPLYVTAFADAAAQWGAQPYSAGPWQRSRMLSGNGADTTDYAVSVSAEAIRLLADGADGIGYWQAADEPWIADSFGLVDLEGRLRPAEQAFQSWLSLVPKEAQIAQVSGQGNGISAVAFRGKNILALVVANSSRQPRVLTPRIEGAKPGRLLNEHGYIGVGMHTGLIPGFYGKLENGGVVISMPPRSVVAMQMAQ